MNFMNILLYLVNHQRTRTLIKHNNIDSIAKLKYAVKNPSSVPNLGTRSLLDIACAYNRLMEIMRCSRYTDLVEFLVKRKVEDKSLLDD